MRIFIARHPETLDNKSNRFTGWKDSPYSKEGKEQFKKILKYFEHNKNKIYSSDLPRCLKLAESISKKNKSKLLMIKLLRERNFKETKLHSFFETKEEFKKRVKIFLKKYDINNSIMILHSGVMVEIIKLLFKNDKIIEKLNVSRDTIFIIETNKKQKRIYKVILKDGI